MPIISSRHHRFAELDIIRTLAVILMIIYHIAFDLAYFYNFNIEINQIGWKSLQVLIAVLFLVLVGISFAISWEKTIIRNGKSKFSYTIRKYLKRGLFVFICGMLITVVTYIIEPSTYIRFGILHMIGISIMLLPLFIRFREINLIIGLIIIIAGQLTTFINNFQLSIFNYQLFLPFGFTPQNFNTLDYYPLIPWFGIVLIGLAIGNFFYIRRKAIPKLPNKFIKILSLPGRHALLIYLVHQPIILAILKILLRNS